MIDFYLTFVMPLVEIDLFYDENVSCCMCCKYELISALRPVCSERS